MVGRSAQHSERATTEKGGRERGREHGRERQSKSTTDGLVEEVKERR